MGEAIQQYPHLSAQDCYNVDLDLLTFEIDAEEAARMAVLTPPPPVKPVSRNVSKRSAKVVEITQPVSQTVNLSKCLWCGKPFHGRSNKRFCTPSTERGLNFKRRQALITAVAEQFKQWGWYARTGTLQDVAKKCVDVEYENFLKRMPKLGWKYEKQCQWIKA